jgi:hypothetical protein
MASTLQTALGGVRRPAARRDRRIRSAYGPQWWGRATQKQRLCQPFREHFSMA